MPFRKGFGLEVLVGGKPLVEYEHEDKVYVESDLNDDEHSQVKILRQLSKDGEQEQAWPVTPFKIRVTVPADRRFREEMYQVRIFVDGFRSQTRIMAAGTTFVSDGFAEFSDEMLNIREYCFSLPRYAQHQGDKVDEQRSKQIGTIRLEFYSTRFEPPRNPYYTMSRLGPSKNKTPAYVQATKRDALSATGGDFTACTTMLGDVTNSIRLRRDPQRMQPRWKSFKPAKLLQEIVVHYRMGHDLVTMGLKVKPEEKPILVMDEDDDVKKDEMKQMTSSEECGTTLSPLSEEQVSSTTSTDGSQTKSELKCEENKPSLVNGHAKNNDNTNNPTSSIFHLAPKQEIKIDVDPKTEIDDDEDELELVDSYIMVSDGEEDDIYIVEDLVDPTILEVDDSMMDHSSGKDISGCCGGGSSEIFHSTPAPGKTVSRRSSLGLGQLGMPD